MSRDAQEFATFDDLARTIGANGSLTAPLQPYHRPASVVVDGRDYRLATVHATEVCARTVIIVVMTPAARDALGAERAPAGGELRLTAREREIAELLANRRTNEEIADILGISRHTARNHVQQILGKLGVSSRRDVSSALCRTSHR